MTELQITASATPNNLNLKIVYPPLPNLTYNFKLTLTLSPQNQQPLIQKSIYLPEKQIKMGPVPGNKIYKVEVVCNMNSIMNSKNVYCFVPEGQQEEGEEDAYSQSRQEQSVLPVNSRARSQQNPSQVQYKNKSKVKEVKRDTFSNSEALMKMVGKAVGINNDKKLQRYILEGRKCKNTSQFLNTRKQRQSGNHVRAIQKQKMLLKGKMVMRDVYQEGQGKTFFKNDWFMGPFYSYDHNEQQMAKH